jgi:uncharacterized membrane protein
VQGKANFRGHPLHLILISFPVAFWTAALFTDSVGTWRHDDFGFHMSEVLIAMGTAVAVPAAICGYIDYRTVPMKRAARNVASGHLWWSLGATALFAVTLAVRASARHSPWGIVLTIAGGGVLLVGGYLGSELANRFQIGVVDAGTRTDRKEKVASGALRPRGFESRPTPEVRDVGVAARLDEIARIEHRRNACAVLEFDRRFVKIRRLAGDEARVLLVAHFVHLTFERDAAVGDLVDSGVLVCDGVQAIQRFGLRFAHESRVT